MSTAVPRSPAPFEGEDGYVALHGLRHHYLRWGSPGEDQLVLLHGMMNHGRYWEHIAQDLAKDHEVYAPDLRGHGESEHAPGGYLVWAFAEDLKAMLQELEIESLDLVAHSIGSRVAMAYAREHSHRIRRLVLVDMGPQMAEQGARGIRRSTAEATGKSHGFETEAEALEHFGRQYPGRSEEFLRRQIAASLELDAASGQLMFRFDPAIHQATGRAAIVETPFLWESLEHIKCPTLVVRAEKSRVLSEELQAEMLRRLPHGTGAVIPDAGHQVPLHQPEAFIKVLREFLA